MIFFMKNLAAPGIFFMIFFMKNFDFNNLIFFMKIFLKNNTDRYTPRNRETYPFFLFFYVFLAEKHQGNVFRVLETPKNTCFYDIYYYVY